MLTSIKNRIISIKNGVTKREFYITLVIIISILLLLSVGFGFYKTFTKLNTLSTNLALLKSDHSSTTAILEAKIAESYSALSGDLNAQKSNVGDIANQLGSYQQEVGSISSTVNTLQKLSKTDPELLQKYSKVFFLNENYSPARLTELPKDFSYSDNKTLTIHADVWPHLQALINDAKNVGVDIYVLSAFRSFNEQTALKGAYSVTYGAGTANSFSADQGYSEHQLGTTVDFMTTGINGELSKFETTKAYQWLSTNASRYGFTMSYPKDNPFYVYEPWHFRYVGLKLATDLANQGKHFYDLDQRTIDEYLVNLF